MDEDDLEDLEARLYSQIHHLQPEEPHIDNEPGALPEPEDTMRPKNRYYKEINAYSKRTFSKPDTCNKKQFGQKKALNDNLAVQQVVVLSSYQDIVRLSKKEKLKRKKEKRRQQQERRKAERAANEEMKQKQTVQVTSTSKAIEDVITISDVSDNEEAQQEQSSVCKMEKDTKCEDVNVGSNVDDPDVIFVETPAPEVINIDDDPEILPDNSVSAPDQNNPSAPDNSKFSDAETSSAVSSSNSVNCTSPGKRNTMTPKERKELLNTPESTSNDFIENPDVEANQLRFNFSVHGSDFNGDDFVRPANPAERCETESSSSITDVHAALKTSVFSEIEFPKNDMFAEGNLENFSNFITPVRNSAAKETSAEINKQNNRNSDIHDSSSSESDYEETEANVSKNSRNLPVLSPMVPETPIKKTTKRKLSQALSSKFDLLEDCTKEVAVKPKRKSSFLPQAHSSEKKQKKKKSSVGRSQKAFNLETQEQSALEECTPELISAISNDKTVDSGRTAEENKSKSPNLDNSCHVKDKDEPAAVLTNEQKDYAHEVVKIVNNSPTEELLLIDVESELEGLIIIDETFASESQLNNSITVISSDAESELSGLGNADHDISLINCPTAIPVDQPEKNVKSPKKGRKSLRKSTLQEVQNQMSDDPKLWQIVESDRLMIRTGSGAKRCYLCKELGHKPLRCPNRYRPPKCKLCGNEGHYEPRCPNGLCTQCGRPGRYSTAYCMGCYKWRRERCHLCGVFGHISAKCPDLWRRYHLTTQEGALITQDKTALKPKNQLWCSNCAKSGHLEHNCQLYNPSYPVANPCIQSYDDVYESAPKRNSRDTPAGMLNSPERPKRPFNQSSSFNNSYNSHQPSTDVLPSNLIQHPYIQPLPGLMDGGNQILQQQIPFNQTNSSMPGPYPDSRTHYDNFTNSHDQTFIQNESQNSFRGVVLIDESDPNAYYFEDNLPNFLSFDNAPAPVESSFPLNYNDYHYPQNDQEIQVIPEKQRSPPRTNGGGKPRHSLFFTQPAGNIQQFLSVEFRKLRSLNDAGFKLKTLKSSVAQGIDCYRQLNMILFGVYLMQKGKVHLQELSKFRMAHPKTRLTMSKRHVLFAAYNYIFGTEKHKNVNYKQLLHSIA